ncbi:MAG: phytanoyl-CoA hydroxylase, partial [Gammaproteobacteria bacterium]
VLHSMNEIVDNCLDPAMAPVEFEVDVHYPGAPADRSAIGGHTPRRLLHALSRHPNFLHWAGHVDVVDILRRLLASDNLDVSQNHHNCIMTKYPGYSSVTNWHQDIRYWSFDRPELISVWLALGPEYEKNGGLRIIPGSHKIELERGRLDATLFLRTDIEENFELIDSAINLELDSGDTLFFHCRTFHAAGRNQTEAVKRSLVFTYRASDNEPIPETRSANFVDLKV